MQAFSQLSADAQAHLTAELDQATEDIRDRVIELHRVAAAACHHEGVAEPSRKSFSIEILIDDLHGDLRSRLTGEVGA